MLIAPCPACGAELRFRSIALPVKVCDYCRSAVVRSGDDLTAMGKIATVPDDVSPLQIGTRGQYRHDEGESGFELVGRLRWKWSDGAWNEWVVAFDDGSWGWLADAMGRFMMLFELPAAESARMRIAQKLKAGQSIEVGTRMTFAGTDYIVNDVRDVVCIGSEGEMPFSTPPGLTMASVDLGRSDGRCLSIQRDRGSVSAYRGHYLSLAELRPSGLRAFEGWTMPGFAS